MEGIGEDSLPTKVGRHLTPFLGLPLNDGIAVIVRIQPIFCTHDDLEQFLGLWSTFQLGLAFTLVNPKYGIIRIGINRLVVQSLLPTKCQSMHNG